MIPIQTRVYDTTLKIWLQGDNVTNLFTHPDTDFTEGLSVFLACPSRYKVCRWTGELDHRNAKIYIGDHMCYGIFCGYYVVEEGSKILVQDLCGNFIGLLSDLVSQKDKEFCRSGAHILHGS